MAGAAGSSTDLDHPTLDNLTLARKEGWAAFVNAVTPDNGRNHLTRSAIRALGDAARQRLQPLAAGNMATRIWAR